MITPSFSLTATERVLPNFALDFTSGVLDSRVTFTRASTGTYFNSAGALTSAAINEARFDYNPTTLAALGLLIEESRTNLVLNSATLITQNVTVTAVAHTLSFYGTGTVVISGTGTGTLVGSGAFPTRSTLTFTPTVGVVILTVTGTVTQAQLEVGSFATSYIPTTAAAATRAADNAVITGTNFSSWYNATEGTLCASVVTATTTTVGAALSINDNTSSNAIQIYYFGSAQYQVVTGGVSQATLAASSTGTFKAVGSYKVNDFAASFNGAAATTDTSGTIPTVSQLRIGALGGGSSHLNGTIKYIAYYPLRLTNAEVQAFSK